MTRRHSKADTRKARKRINEWDVPKDVKQALEESPSMVGALAVEGKYYIKLPGMTKRVSEEEFSRFVRRFRKFDTELQKAFQKERSKNLEARSALKDKEEGSVFIDANGKAHVKAYGDIFPENKVLKLRSKEMSLIEKFFKIFER